MADGDPSHKSIDVDALAALHARAFETPRPWSAAEFRQFLDDRFCTLTGDAQGFAVLRTVAGETEVLTLAVAPELRRQGRGRAVMRAALAEAIERGAQTAFLEVATDNGAAIALYSGLGFVQAGLRPNYYARPDGTRLDALVMSCALETA